MAWFFALPFNFVRLLSPGAIKQVSEPLQFKCLPFPPCHIPLLQHEMNGAANVQCWCGWLSDLEDVLEEETEPAT